MQKAFQRLMNFSPLHLVFASPFLLWYGLRLAWFSWRANSALDRGKAAKDRDSVAKNRDGYHREISQARITRIFMNADEANENADGAKRGLAFWSKLALGSAAPVEEIDNWVTAKASGRMLLNAGLTFALMCMMYPNFTHSVVDATHSAGVTGKDFAYEQVATAVPRIKQAVWDVMKPEEVASTAPKSDELAPVSAQPRTNEAYEERMPTPGFFPPEAPPSPIEAKFLPISATQQE